MNTDTITQIPLAELHESAFNPRRLYAGLEELAANITAEGRIHEPLLVRPRLTNPLRDDLTDGYEIVFGHRRARAAELANLASVPCMVRALTDAEARSAQVAENLQRADVHPFEEAEAFRVMLDAGDANADELAARFGKSRSYVYGRLALLKACPDVRRACLAGEVGSEVALLLARLRTDKLQAKALQYIRAHNLKLEDGGGQSFRRIRDLLQERFTLGLKDAMFDTADAVLLPDAGACSACPKRVGNAPEYADLASDRITPWGAAIKGSADTCTDPDCFDAKKKAHLALRATELQAKGKTVLAGNAARAAVGARGEVKGAYVALKDVREALKKAKGEKPATVTIQDPRTGKTIEAVKRDALQAAGAKVDAPRNDRANFEAQTKRHAAERKAAEAKLEAENARRLALLQRVRAAVAGAERNAFDLGLVVQAAMRGVPWEARVTLAGLWGFTNENQLDKQVGNMSAADLTRLVLDCALVVNVHVDNSYRLSEKPEALLAAAKHYGVAIDEPGTPAKAARAAKGVKADEVVAA